MWLLWWPKNTPSTTNRGVSGSAKTTNNGGCGHVSKFLKKVMMMKRKRRRMRRLNKASRTWTSYDPLSYALNFDSSGVHDEDYYYRFYAFSSRFVANYSITINNNSPIN
ncbi:hypothetical protein ACFE04_012272 [Oxalis oulophora]